MSIPSTAPKITPPDDPQFDLFQGLPADSRKFDLKTARDSGRRFVTGEPKAIFLGTVPLADYLKQSGQVAPFTVAQLLDEQDWSVFENRYGATGRAPYSPRLMLGLILYGVMQGVHSLRELERLARLDLGCMWVTGGITPDHTNIGRFIGMHEASLTQGFFEGLTSSILAATGSRSTRVAGDGTVIEAACSHYKLLKEEAVKARVEVAQRDLESHPDDVAAQLKQQASAERLRIFEERKKARQRSGRATDTLGVSPTEPEAMVQRLKRGRGTGPSYKPSVLANEDRIVTALDVHPSMETKVVATMLDQSKRVTGEPVNEVLLDAGYFDDGVIAATLEREVSLLCPEGQTPEMPKASAAFHKSQFQYDPTSNQYRCPAGQQLILLRNLSATPGKRAYALYGTTACENCASRADCTKTAARKIRRHPEEGLRDALRQVMEHPQARAIFAKRKAMVEPVFSHLRGQQGLNRFRRQGLKQVKSEFALHIMAYNLSRAVALLRALLPALSAVLDRIVVLVTEWSLVLPRIPNHLAAHEHFRSDHAVA
jgi:transposase